MSPVWPARLARRGHQTVVPPVPAVAAIVEAGGLPFTNDVLIALGP